MGAGQRAVGSGRARWRPQDWASFAAFGALVCALTAAGRGAWMWALAWATATIVATVLARAWSHRYPGPMPHSLRWTLRLPRGPLTTERVLQVLDPRPGERVLEVGPGIGMHALPVAERLRPGGTLEVLDAQRAMLDTLAESAARAGVTNIVATAGDAERLPYPDQSFDAAYLIGVLGEIPDPGAALAELRRVLKPSGRLVIGETIFDPDYVSIATLQEETGRAGLALAARSGPAAGYVARFHPKVDG